MLRVALTGGIGSGKSAVAHMLRALGAYVSQSDQVARGRMQRGQPLIDAPWRTRFDRVVVVSAEVNLRQQRYVARVGAAGPRQRDEAGRDFQRRLLAQWGDPEREALADDVVRNNGSLDALRECVALLYVSLRAEAADRQHEAM